MLAPQSCRTLDLILTTMFWRPAPHDQLEPVDADELLARLANDDESVEDIAIWLQEERALPAAAAEHIAERYAARTERARRM
jgi:hypothetical protein